MGNICKIDINQNCVPSKIDKQHKKIDKGQQKREKELIIYSPTRKQYPLEKFTYDLKANLDQFNEEFYNIDYVYENSSCLFQRNTSDLDFTFLEQDKSCKFISQAIIKNKRQVNIKNYNSTQKQINSKYTSKYLNLQKSQNSLDLPKKIFNRGILKNPSRSFDSIYTRKKSVRFSNKLQLCVI